LRNAANTNKKKATENTKGLGNHFLLFIGKGNEDIKKDGD
jgi:hypothetical protein